MDTESSCKNINADMNHWANQWRDIAGPNVYPMNDKVPIKEIGPYAHLLGKPIPQELHNYWNDKMNYFNNGIAIENGKCLHNKYKTNLWIHTLDVDSESGKNLILDLFGCKTLEELSKKGVVDRHPGTPKFHMTIFTDGELENLSTNDSGVELKGSQKLTTVSPTRYEDGTYRELVGDSLNTMGSPVPIPHEKFMYALHEKLLPFGVKYLNGKASGYNPVSRNKQKIPNGQRHTKLVSYANSLIARLYKTTNMQTIQRFFDTYNNEECEVPLPVREVDQIFKDAWNNIGKSTTKIQEQKQVLSVLEAKRLHIGEISVIGTITSVSDMYVLEIKNDEKVVIEYKNAKSIQLEDIETLDDNDRLDVVLYDDMINNVVAGETVKISGYMRIEDKKPNGKSKKKFNVLHASSIEYLNRKEILVTKEDIESFEKFVTYPNLTGRLTVMFAPNIIGHSNIKRGLLRSAVGGVDRGKNGGGRIDTLEVGDPGTAKSKLGAEITELKPNSRHVSAPHGTSKTITAVPEKINEIVTVMLGAIPLSKGGICAIDEINSWSMDEQGLLLDIMEEGFFDFNKMGVRRRIPAPTTIVATLNPVGGKWNNPDVATTEEFNLKRSLMDRFSQIYTTRDSMNEEQVDDFISKMDVINKRKPFNYNFLRKYLIYASSIKDVKFTNDARGLLNAYWKKGKLKNSLSIRMYKSLYKIAEAQAKLQLKDIVDEVIAQQTIDDFDDMMTQYNKAIGKILGPQEVTYKLCLDILQESDVGMTIEEMCRIVVHKDNQVLNYLGYVWQIEHNHKVKDIVDSLLNHPNVKKVQRKPIILQWLSDPSDPSDVKTENKSCKNNINITNDILENEENNSQTTSDTSDTSAGNDKIECPQPECNYQVEPYYMKTHIKNTHEGEALE